MKMKTILMKKTTCNNNQLIINNSKTVFSPNNYQLQGYNN